MFSVRKRAIAIAAEKSRIAWLKRFRIKCADAGIHPYSDEAAHLDQVGWPNPT